MTVLPDPSEQRKRAPGAGRPRLGVGRTVRRTITISPEDIELYKSRFGKEELSDAIRAAAHELRIFDAEGRAAWFEYARYYHVCCLTGTQAIPVDAWILDGERVTDDDIATAMRFALRTSTAHSPT